MHPGESPPRRKLAPETRRTSGGAARRTGRSVATTECRTTLRTTGVHACQTNTGWKRARCDVLSRREG
eukprot:13204614-Alexandrium_andersonii.AAC.1